LHVCCFFIIENEFCDMIHSITEVRADGKVAVVSAVAASLLDSLAVGGIPAVALFLASPLLPTSLLY
jgi:hypothetical protein